MKKRIFAFMVVLAMVISIIPMSAITVGAANGANLISANKTVLYSVVDNWTNGNYTTYSHTDGIYTIPVKGSTATKKQAFRVNDLPLEINTTYIFSVKAKTDGTFTDVNFHNGHSCLQLNATVLGAESIGADWTELKYALSFGVGSNSADTTSCGTASHGKLTPFGGSKAPIIHAGVYFKSVNDCTLQVKDFQFYKVGEFTVTPSMDATENVGETAEIAYAFSSAPAAAPASSNFVISGGTGAVTSITKVSDTAYKATITGLTLKKEYTVTLSGLKDAELGIAFPEASIKFGTVGYISDPDIYAYETFDSDIVGQSSTYFTGGNQVVQLKEGSTTDKVVALSTLTNETSTIGYKLNKAVTAESGVVEFSFDMFRKDNMEKNVRFYINGGGVISGQFNRSSLSAYYPDPIGTLAIGTPNSTGWNHIAIRVDTAKQIYTVAVNGRVTLDDTGMAKEFPFRSGSTAFIDGFFNMDKDATTKTVLIDNFIVRKIEGNKSVFVNFDYENTTSTGVSGSFTSIAPKRDDGDASNGIESGSALEFDYVVGGTDNDTYSGGFTLPTELTSGVAEVSFDIYRSSTAPRIQFYLNGDGALVNSYITADGTLGQHTLGKITKIPTDKWVNIKYKMNLYAKTFTVTVDGVEYSTYKVNGVDTAFPFRNTTSTKLSTVTIYSCGSKVTDATKVQLDNLTVSTDVTNYHMSVSGAGIIVDSGTRTLSQCPIGGTVGDFLDELIPTPADCVLEVYSETGTLKSSTDTLEKYDVVKIVYEAAGRTLDYTVVPNYSVDFTALVVNGNEYYEASKVIEPGEATVRANVVNNTTTEKTFMVYGAVVGDKLYDVKLVKNVTVPGRSKKDIKLMLNLPDGSDDTQVKLFLADPADGITPLGDTETSLVYTSKLTKMPNIFSDHMVLQRNEPVNIFGFAPTGTPINVTFGSYAAEGEAEAGKFCVQLPAMNADSAGKTLTVVAGDTIFTYDDVVVGEVIYGSGQSNMQRGVSYANGAVALGYIPNIRNFGTKSLYTTKDRIDGTIDEKWGVATTSNWKNISGTMYCTAYYLRELGAIPEDVVIGIVNASWGGTSIAMWLPDNIIEKGPHTAFYTSYLAGTRDSKGIRNADLYSAMAKSVVPYTAKAAVWYQGEHDSGITTYNWYMDEYVRVMREDFGKDIPYYIVQLPGYSTASWSEFRLTQWKSHDPENGVHVVVTNDTGDNGDIHPHDKHLVGERIARQIASQTYGMDKVPYQGPVFKSATANGSQVTISFDYVNDGIHGGLCSLANDNSLTKFEVSADGTTWKAATASISGDTIVVSSSEVSAPKYVRYGYIPQILKSAGTNTNGVKLPLAPFSEAIN